jgi:replicative DNA helicase
MTGVASIAPQANMPLANIEAELAVLGSLLYENKVLGQIADLHPDHFYDPMLQDAFRTALDLIERGDNASPVSVVEAMGGERVMLRPLADAVVDAAPTGIRTDADIIINAARLRHVVGIADEIRQSARAGTDAFDLISNAEREFSRLVQESAPASTNLIDARSSAHCTLDEIDREAREGRARGVMTGLRCFDRRMRGLRPGWLVVVAGRPSMGKTALARAAAFGAAERTKGQVVFFALEMARRELDERTLSQMSHLSGDGIAYKDMNGDTLPASERARLRDLAHRVPSNLIIDDSPILSVDYVRRRVLALKQRGPVPAVFIDYLQIMDRPSGKGRNEASVIGEMTKGLKQLAREAETCVVLLSQINRGVESRDDKRPQLSDLRESGAIEQDANAVLFPYRPVYYLERAEPTDRNKREAWEMECAEVYRKMDVIAAKVRQGAVGHDEQVYYAEFDHIEDAAEERR